jgi:serine/threonine-protein kinase
VTDAQQGNGDGNGGDGGAAAGRIGLVGKALGRYRISAELGRGGMATVYRAFDPQLSRDVAVKVIHGAFAGRGDIERRFRREAQAVAGLKHEGIVGVFDFAPGGDGEPAYIVSELVEGPTLRQLLERGGGRLLPEIATAIGARVAAALGAAHARGIVHRDVKPDNVMIDAAGAEARVLLTDFGIARMIEDDTLTATGSILGSPSYMSPEQARGSAAGPASDVFSLGVMLYQLATGRVPFPGKDPLAVIAAIAGGQFLRPSQVDARMGPELEAVILRCLRRAPAERFADGAAVHAALREVGARAVLPSSIATLDAALRRFLDGPAELERAIGGAVADDAVERARRCLRRGELGRALAHASRALAYAPGHRGAEAALAAVSARRRWLRVAAIAGAVVMAGGAGALALRHKRAQPQLLPAPVTVAARSAPPAASAAPSPLRAVVPAAARTPAVAPAPAPAIKRRPLAHKHIVADVVPEAPRAATAPVVQAEAATATATPTPTTGPGPNRAETIARVPAAAPTPSPAAGLTLRASYGFCSPSLDDEAPALRPVYRSVPAGTHRIFCTMPGGSRVLVGAYQLRAGTHPDLVIVPGPDGRPVLGHVD